MARASLWLASVRRRGRLVERFVHWQWNLRGPLRHVVAITDASPGGGAMKSEGFAGYAAGALDVPAVRFVGFSEVDVRADGARAAGATLAL